MENNKQNALIKKEPGSIVKYPGPERIYVMPPADLLETADDFILKLDMPGVSKESVSLIVENEQLAIRGNTDYNTEENAEMLYGEICWKNYYRVFRLGKGIDREKISAVFGDGVLSITLPKTEKSKAIEIKIN